MSNKSAVPFSPEVNVAQIQNIDSMKIPKDKYEDYVAFVCMIVETLTDSEQRHEIIFGAKILLDHVLDTFTQEELLVMTLKEDYFLYFIVYRCCKILNFMNDEEFEECVEALKQEYETDTDDDLYTSKIELTLQNILSWTEIVSPQKKFLEHENLLSASVQRKVKVILPYLVTDSSTFLMNSNQIFGMLLEWASKCFSIQNLNLEQVIDDLLINCSKNSEERESTMSELMENVFNQ